MTHACITCPPPCPPAGVLERRPFLADRGEIARWRTPSLPYLEASLFAGPVASVTVATGPARLALEGITDPAELRRCARLLDAAATWLEQATTAAEPGDDPQLSIFDHLEAAP